MVAAGTAASHLSQASPLGLLPQANSLPSPWLEVGSSEGRTHRGGTRCTATHPRPLGSSEIPSLTEPLGPAHTPSHHRRPAPWICSLRD